MSEWDPDPQPGMKCEACGHVLGMPVPETEGPCFDPTCDCCVAWRALDDQRLAEIERLNRKVADLMAQADAFAEECREWTCDLHHGRPTEPDTPTWCFTCHERFPCSGERLRSLAAAYDARRAEQ